jgi:hypothetical protein
LSSDARLTRLTLSSAEGPPFQVLPGVRGHPFGQVDQPVLMTGRHGVGQLPQFNGESVQVLVEYSVTHQSRPSSVYHAKARKHVSRLSFCFPNQYPYCARG